MRWTFIVTVDQLLQEANAKKRTVVRAEYLCPQWVKAKKSLNINNH